MPLSLYLNTCSSPISLPTNSDLPDSYFTIRLSSLPVAFTLVSGNYELGRCALYPAQLPSRAFDVFNLSTHFCLLTSYHLPPLNLTVSLLNPPLVPIASLTPRVRSIPLYIGHRGQGSSGPHAPWRVPENTPESFLLAAEGGAEAIELDVQLTKCGEVVVWHDWKVKGKGLWDIDIDEMKTMVKEEGLVDQRVRTGEVGRRGRGGVWTLEQVLNVLPENIGVFVEIKYPGRDVTKDIFWGGAKRNETVDKVLAVMEKAGGNRWMKILSFDPDVAERAALKQNKWGVMLSCCETLDRPCEMTDRRCTKVVTAWKWAQRSGIEGLMMFSEVAEKKDVIEWIRESGGSVVTYGKKNGDAKYVTEMLKRGVQGIIADDVGVLIKAMNVEESK